LSDAVLVHLRAGQKIAAIKQYRDETGADLRTAKDAVEQALR
jgi:ribosomal protein L7/L12